MLGDMRHVLITCCILFALAGCEGGETPAVELNFPLGELGIAEIAARAVCIGIDNGFEIRIKDPDPTTKMNDGLPAVLLTFNRGPNQAVIVSTLAVNDPISVTVFASGFPNEATMDAIADDFATAFAPETTFTPGGICP